MKISALNSYSFNNVNFEGHKKKEVGTPIHKASPAKAIPVTLLIAMSPVNAQIPTGPREAKQVENIVFCENDTIAEFPFKNATPEGNVGAITIYDSGENKRTIGIHLNKHIRSYAVDINNNVVEGYRLKEIDIVPEELSSKTEIRNYLGGKQVVKKNVLCNRFWHRMYIPSTAIR